MNKIRFLLVTGDELWAGAPPLDCLQDIETVFKRRQQQMKIQTLGAVGGPLKVLDSSLQLLLVQYITLGVA